MAALGLCIYDIFDIGLLGEQRGGTTGKLEAPSHRYNALLVDVIIKMSPPRLGLGATANNQDMNGL
jgi:hypothetical protein